MRPVTSIDRTTDAWLLASLIKQRRISSEELVKDSFRKIEQWNPELNAVTHLRKEKALAKSRAHHLSDKPFGGVPVLLKGLGQDMEGEASTSGAKLLKENTASKTSHFAKRLQEAGFIVLGQTNAPEFGFTNVTNPELYGPARNPWDVSRSPGGSSGGSAAAVASGMVPAAGASDGGGSIRIPASFTGLVGLKPTRGRTPVGPGSGRSWQGAAISFMLTKSIRDTAALLDTLQVIQPQAAFQAPLFEEGYVRSLQEAPKKAFRIAYSLDSPVGSPVSKEAVNAVLNLVKWLSEKGYTVEEAAPPVDGVALMKSYYVMNSGETAAMMRRLARNLQRELTLEDMELLTWVLFQSGRKLSAADYSDTFGEWDRAAEQMAHFHETYDLLLTPATSEPAPLVDRDYQDAALQEKMRNITEYSASNQQQIVWGMFEKSLAVTPFSQQANLTGQPSISLPTHLTKEGLPLGVQLTAPKGKEDWLLGIGQEMEQDGLFI